MYSHYSQNSILSDQHEITNIFIKNTAQNIIYESAHNVYDKNIFSKQAKKLALRLKKFIMNFPQHFHKYIYIYIYICMYVCIYIYMLFVYIIVTK